MTQKFTCGDLVHITKDMPSTMSHFDRDVDAVVLYSYADAYGGDDTKSYSLFILKNGKPFKKGSWYKEDQLILKKKFEI